MLHTKEPMAFVCQCSHVRSVPGHPTSSNNFRSLGEDIKGCKSRSSHLGSSLEEALKPYLFFSCS